jgi:lipoate---protein ligase
LWHDDVGRAMWWVGELWCRALRDLAPDAVVHRGPMVRTAWSADVCFAGTGPGELMRGDAKLVGISQRRTRSAARFQTMIHRRWRPDVVASLVSGGPKAADLAGVASAIDAESETITACLTEALSGE